MADADITIFRATRKALVASARRQVETIFFEASTRTFEPGPEREAFLERWLGRYLAGPEDEILLALACPDTVAGYLVGALRNPAEQARFDDIGYFKGAFADLCRQYPAHLHINLAPAFRSLGIGARLIDAFADAARGAGAPGMHVVTGKGMRNVRFYQRCGLTEQGATVWNGRPVVFLARSL